MTELTDAAIGMAVDRSRRARGFFMTPGNRSCLTAPEMRQPDVGTSDNAFFPIWTSSSRLPIHIIVTCGVTRVEISAIH